MLWLNSQQEMVSGCCTYTLLFGLFLSIDMPFLDLTFALKDDHPPMSCFMFFFSLYPVQQSWGFIGVTFSLACICCPGVCAHGVQGTFLLLVLCTAPLNILQSDLVWWHIVSWSFKRASLTAMGQNHEGGFQLPEAILYSSVLWSVESFSDQTCTWCIVSRQKAKEVGGC